MGGDLSKARRLYRSGKFSDLIRLLEPQVFRFRESFEFYRLLGMSCLYTGDLAGAYSYLKRASQLDENDVEATLAVAVIHLKRQELPEAIELLLAVQEAHPRNRIARRALDFVKNNPDPVAIAQSIEGRRIRRFLPPTGALRHFIPRAAAIGAACAVVILAAPFAVRYVESRQQPSRPGLEQMNLPNEDRIANTSGQYRYLLTRDQILQAFARMKSDFGSYRDNLAQKEINLLTGSNASEPIKERARLLGGYLRAPSFATMRDSFAYRDVAKDPFLYQNCYVDWKGMVSNLKITSKVITFDFLVGYHDERVLEGIVPVTLTFGANIDTSLPIEVLGRVTIVGDRITLQGISIHELAPVNTGGAGPQ